MNTRPSKRVRMALVGVLAVLLAGLLVPSVTAQFPRGGQPVMPGAPGMPIAPPGMPGGGGMTDPRMPGNPFAGPRFAPVPPSPEIQRPFNMPGPIGPLGPGGLGGGLGVEKVWTCSGCGKEIGRGNFPPATCPHCQARIMNGIGGGDRPAQGGQGLQPEPRGFDSRPQPAPGAFGGDFRVPNQQQEPPNRGPVINQEFGGPELEPQIKKAAEEKERASTGRTVLTVVGIVGGLGVVLIIGLVLLAILTQSGKKKPARRKKRKVARYDYDDDEYVPRSKRRRYDD